jgi:hypothetical protein
MIATVDILIPVSTIRSCLLRLTERRVAADKALNWTQQMNGTQISAISS